MKYHTILRTCYPHAKIEDDCYNWWERHQLKIQQVQQEKYDIIFIGDSITHFFHSAEGAGNSENEKIWQEFFGNCKVLNLGYGYDRPQNTLWHLDNGEFESQHPKLIVLNIGTNCFSISERYDGDSPETAFEGIKTVIERLFELSPESKLILMEIFPRRPLEIQDKIDRTNCLLRKFANSDERITLLSLSDKLAPAGELNIDLYADKTCHPNARGYRFWGEILAPYIKKFIEK
ncbi:MAG: hypothetical protein IJW31_05590 [Lentisphaeria bacterium]|nr:hypothetical protein [Lentisphaeria bacterium]